MVTFTPFRRFLPYLLWLLVFPFFSCTTAFSQSTTTQLLTDPYEIFHSHYRAIGGIDRLEEVTSSYSEGRTRYDGLQGTFRHWEKRPIQYRTEEDYGIITQIEGDSGKSSWFLDTNGQLMFVRNEETLKRREIALLLDSYEHLKRDSQFFSLTYSGLQKVDMQDCYQITLLNSINSDRTQFFFATESLHLVKSINQQPDTDIIVTFGDFRWTKGLLLSYYHHIEYSLWNTIEETWITSSVFNPVIEQEFFTPPSPRKSHHFPSARQQVTVNFQFIEDLIYIPVTVGSDTQYWILDSGASMSVIDASYAKKQGYQVKGNVKGFGFGENFELSFVELPHYSVGGIEFLNQKLYVSEGLAERSYEPEIAGIIGYDFLSRFVVEIDYAKQIATFHSPDGFEYTGSGKTIDAPLKYRTFSLPVYLENQLSRWSLDLGSFQSSIHYPYAEKHDLLNRQGVESVSQGLSSITFEKTVQFSCLKIGDYSLNSPLITVPTGQGVGATALGELGGNLGNSTLKHFNLFLDYPNQRVIFEKGQHFHTSFPKDTSGLLIGRSENNQPMVSFIAENSPAAKAGLIAGDIITELEGFPVKPGDKVVPLRHFLRAAPGSHLNITVERSDRQIPFTIILEELYYHGQQDCNKQ